MDRIAVLSRHLTAAAISEEQLHGVSAVTVTDVCPKLLYAFQLHDNAELRAEIFELLKHPLYQPNFYQPLMDFRAQTLQRLQHFCDAKLFSIRDYTRDPRKFMAALECLSFCDYSLAIKAGVHFTLCGGTLMKLGTKKHHDLYMDRIDSLDLPGCFAMSELGHGSNVMGIETTANYDKATGEFVINTPEDAASKFWIGGAAQHGKICTVFAQLTVDGKWEGPHVFAVRIRDDAGHITPGIRIRDNGAKMGLNGVDNGRIWFDKARVPRDALLDAFSSVDANGVFTSSIPSVGQRFGTMVGGLTSGRILIATGAIDAAKIGITIALRYSCQRPQFGDKPIIDYITHQRRLLPALSNCYALQLAMGSLKMIQERKDPKDGKLVHVLSSGLKAAATWSRVEALQNARECCGGQGFLAINKIGTMKTDMDVDTTFEGDNTVLMQQVAKALLDDHAAASNPPKLPVGAGLTDGINALALAQLLQFREKALVYEVASHVARAAKAAGPDKKAAAKAADGAFNAHLDRVLLIGWANVESFCLDNFIKEVGRADKSLQPALQMLAELYGMSRVERDLAFFLASGALTREDAVALRAAVHLTYATMIADHGKLALALCAGFGIPDHLLQAPIAFNWRTDVQ